MQETLGRSWEEAEGAGKSTLLDLLGAVHKKESGETSLDDSKKKNKRERGGEAQKKRGNNSTVRRGEKNRLISPYLAERVFTRGRWELEGGLGGLELKQQISSGGKGPIFIKARDKKKTDPLVCANEGKKARREGPQGDKQTVEREKRCSRIVSQ